MTYFNFRRLIQKYSREYTVKIKGVGSYNKKGEYVAGTPTEITLQGAIIGFSETKIQRAEGVLSAMDKALHTFTPIDTALIGATVVFEGNEYRIENRKGESNAEFTGVYSYTLKFVSAFNEGAKTDD